MDSLTHIRIRYTKSQRIGFFVFAAGLILIQLATYVLKNKDLKTAEININELQTKAYLAENQKSQSSAITNFDPNQLDFEGWKNLGFSDKQVTSILKYKNLLGGNFSNKQQISESYVISGEKFAEIEAYIVFGNINNENTKSNLPSTQFNDKPKIHYKKFNPNHYSQKDWQNIGFSEKQATTILKYKMSLGGNFSSLKQIQSCFVISPDKFSQMKPYIVLPVMAKEPQKIIEDHSSIRMIEEVEELADDFMEDSLSTSTITLVE